ncbi:hypothetical protein OsccyDRAFT_0356 [Leptolyngbyaceae cyanobacterium JSC-12]|nr:hypothetical protein OsccyDRAFT_0356 [Leptolyngbyaceae cyanobacterium JSC-12]
MKRPCLVITLSASLLGLVGCSSYFLHIPRPTQGESASTLSPDEHFQSARQLAWEAAVLVQHPPHPDSTWQEARVKWRQAIRHLKAIPSDQPISARAKQKLAEYEKKYSVITQRLTDETVATDLFEQAQTAAWQAAVTVQNPPHALTVWQRAAERWERAIRLLEKVPTFTTVSGEAEKKLQIYRNNYQAIAQRIEAEKTFLAAVAQFSATVTQLNMLQTQAVTGKSENPIGLNYEEYQSMVRSLQVALKEIETLPTAKSNPAYTEMKTAIADYEFALNIWQTYLRHKQANADWLQNGDFFNQRVPLSLIDSDRLLQRYNVKIIPSSETAKVPLKSTVWAVWDKANEHARSAQQIASRSR